LNKLARQVNGKDWEFVDGYQTKISAFKAVMPLVVNLKEPAMRQRHWNTLMETVGKTFDPTGDDFTLGAMIDLKLGEFGEEIAGISQAAAQELKIEEKIAEIADVWKESATSNLPINDYKAGSDHKILGGMDDLFAVLEDNQVTLATMKVGGQTCVCVCACVRYMWMWVLASAHVCVCA
jgi:dynein heavy chain